MMSKNISLLFIFLLAFSSINAQDKFAKNAVYLELAGNGGAYSVNYERAFSQKFMIRLGFASWSSSEPFGGEESKTTIPIMVNSLFGNGNHKIEGGLGFMLGSEKYTGDVSQTGRPESKENIFALTGTAGYRYQKPSGGIIFRAGLTPFINLGDSEYPDFNFSGGASVGYAF